MLNFEAELRKTLIPLVTEQSQGEWDEKTIFQDVETLLQGILPCVAQIESRISSLTRYLYIAEEKAAYARRKELSLDRVVDRLNADISSRDDHIERLYTLLEHPDAVTATDVTSRV